ncbi:putative heterokaryon incompatibility protein het-c protein [Golovinomyces cichoracearum]|uniref:Putative heterokaryon incompatibility protein het-c protein n=1 Tax=Golovinomyces cichoracearum TaxID=62708 RepID=A0A420HG21_9PEZI|nr:putative heterokaryon incompatibility protein het-c protein [Golovinomyces cichoracearum]
MALMIPSPGFIISISFLVLFLLPPSAVAFGAGNIPSVSLIEGKNFRHGDIEDMLKTVACIKGHKWTSLMIKRVYFGRSQLEFWDSYSSFSLRLLLAQAVDVGSLKGVSAPTIRILVWVLSFLSFGYATKEFEVTDERLGVYRPEEHIDNPKGYADNKDARKYDQRLRGPIQEAELQIDPYTGMKNYIANENGNWATSSGYVKFSFARSIHFGRLYTSGAGDTRGAESDLCEALRCLGQGLHCLEDFGAHSNYVELALRELGYRNVFPHTGRSTEMNIRGHYVFPLVTGTFGAVDFLHSVLGEANDQFSQTEVEEMDIVLKNAECGQFGNRRKYSLFNCGGDLITLLAKIPGTGAGLSSTARNLQSASQAQLHNTHMKNSIRVKEHPNDRFGPVTGIPGNLPDIDPAETIKKIYPILEFRDNVVKGINKTVAKIPGLESLVEKISQTLTLFILSLLSPYIRPIIDAASKTLKQGSSTVLEASAKAQFGPWNDPICTDPTHSMLSKDHFTNILNGVAGQVATVTLQYVAPRILYAWENPGINVDEIMSDVLSAFHHPALRDESLELHRNMFKVVRKWAEEQPNPHHIDEILGSESVKAGRNHQIKDGSKDLGCHHGALGGHGKANGSIWAEIQNRDLDAMAGNDGRYPTSTQNRFPLNSKRKSSYLTKYTKF